MPKLATLWLEVGEGNRSSAMAELASRMDEELIFIGWLNHVGRNSHTTRQVIKYAARPVMVTPTRI